MVTAESTHVRAPPTGDAESDLPRSSTRTSTPVSRDQNPPRPPRRAFVAPKAPRVFLKKALDIFRSHYTFINTR